MSKFDEGYNQALYEFGELMEKGASLADCLEVAQETVNTDEEELEKMAEAGVDPEFQLGVEHACFGVLKEASAAFGQANPTEAEAADYIFTKVANLGQMGAKQGAGKKSSGGSSGSNSSGEYNPSDPKAAPAGRDINNSNYEQVGRMNTGEGGSDSFSPSDRKSARTPDGDPRSTGTKVKSKAKDVASAAGDAAKSIGDYAGQAGRAIVGEGGTGSQVARGTGAALATGALGYGAKKGIDKLREKRKKDKEKESSLNQQQRQAQQQRQQQRQQKEASAEPSQSDVNQAIETLDEAGLLD